MTVQTVGVKLNASTRQGTRVDYKTLINTHGNLVAATVDEVCTYPNHEYRDLETGTPIHNVVFVPVEHEQHTAAFGRPIIGGWEIHHVDCAQCIEDGTVGRVDSFIFAERVHRAAVAAVDIKGALSDGQ